MRFGHSLCRDKIFLWTSSAETILPPAFQTDAEYKTRRDSDAPIHGPPGTQLRRDFAPMAGRHQRDTRSCCRTGMPLLDTRQTGRDLTGTFVANLVLQILSYVAQTERENIRQKQMERIAAAKLRGVRFGRPRKPLPAEFKQLKEDWKNQKTTSRAAAQQLGVAQDTFLRWTREK